MVAHLCKADLASCLLLLLLCRGRGKGVVGKGGQACVGVGWNSTVRGQSTVGQSAVGQSVVGQSMEAKGRDGEMWKCWSSKVGRLMVKSWVCNVVGGVAVRAVGQAVVAGKNFFESIHPLCKW